MVRLNRRRFLEVILIGTIIKLVSPDASLAASDENIPRKFRWRVPKAYFHTVNEKLRYDGQVTPEKDEKGLPFVFIFVGLVLLPYLANAVLALRREIVFGGVVIDTTGPEIMIKNNKGLDAGIIVVKSSSGTKIYEREEITNPSELVAALLKGQ